MGCSLRNRTVHSNPKYLNIDLYRDVAKLGLLFAVPFLIIPNRKLSVEANGKMLQVQLHLTLGLGGGCVAA